MAGSAAPAARLTEISKAFGVGPPALDRVSLSLAAGEIHAVLGENGAGKSTLMNVLIGAVRPDSGELTLGSGAVDLTHWGPAEAALAGVGMVHQQSALVPAMTAVENLGFGAGSGGFWFRPDAARRSAVALTERFELRVPLDRRVDDLSVGERQRAEILRALERGARVLILDEPTAVLTPGEIESLFVSLRRLREAGRAVVFISHKLSEVEALADRITVLRRGRVTATVPAAEANAATLGRLMLGRDLPPLAAAHRVPVGRGGGPPALEIRGLCAAGASEASALRDVDLRVEAGELLGLVGIDGNGQRELEEVLAGLRRPSAGEIRVAGVAVAPGVRSLRRAGLSHLSGDREGAGLVAGLSLTENFVLKGSYDDSRFFRHGRVDRVAARAAVRSAIETFGIVPGEPDAEIGTLSGGNAQKLAVARELDAAPSVLVAVNPTRGLDVGSARFVHEQLLAVCERGGGVLLISTELDEVLSLAQRTMALVRGRALELPPNARRAEIGAVMLGEVLETRADERDGVSP